MNDYEFYQQIILAYTRSISHSTVNYLAETKAAHYYAMRCLKHIRENFGEIDQ